jgi:hypothetical protein
MNKGLIQTLLSFILGIYSYLLTFGRMTLAVETFTTSKSIFFHTNQALEYYINGILGLHH